MRISDYTDVLYEAVESAKKTSKVMTKEEIQSLLQHFDAVNELDKDATSVKGKDMDTYYVAEDLGVFVLPRAVMLEPENRRCIDLRKRGDNVRRSDKQPSGYEFPDDGSERMRTPIVKPPAKKVSEGERPRLLEYDRFTNLSAKFLGLFKRDFSCVKTLTELRTALPLVEALKRASIDGDVIWNSGSPFMPIALNVSRFYYDGVYNSTEDEVMRDLLISMTRNLASRPNRS